MHEKVIGKMQFVRLPTVLNATAKDNTSYFLTIGKGEY
jgi:hypothetical protein